MSEERYEVRWAESALKDLERIIGQIGLEETQRAKELMEQMREKSKSLELMPHRGRIVPELAEIGIKSHRDLILKPYRIVYRVEKQKVWVLAVFDGRRDLADTLLRRVLEI